MRKSPLRLVLVLTALLPILASCETSRQVAGRSDLAPIPSEFLEPCPAPKLVPDKPTIGDLIEIGGIDGSNLDICQDRHLSLVNAVAERDLTQGQK